MLDFGFQKGKGAIEKDYWVGKSDKGTKKTESFSFLWGQRGRNQLNQFTSFALENKQIYHADNFMLFHMLQLKEFRAKHLEGNREGK